MTSQPFLIFISIAVGAGIAVQALVNARLQNYTHSPTLAALVSFLVGTLVMLVFVLAQRPALNFAAMAQAPWWAWIGGLFGALYILSFVILIPRMSPVVLFGAGILGQMSMLVLAEHIGMFGITRQPVNAYRIIGVVMIVIGTALCKR